jgi:hypothetical protein
MTICRSSAEIFRHQLGSSRRLWSTAFPLLIFVLGYVALIVSSKAIERLSSRVCSYGSIGRCLQFVSRALRVLPVLDDTCRRHASAARRCRTKSRLTSLENLGLCFFAGTGVWHVGMLALGYANLYTLPAAIVVSVPAVALGFFDLKAFLRRARSSVPDPNDFVTTRFWLTSFLTACCLAAAIVLLAVKGLYPAGGHDYYTHYFYYYQSVIERQGLPNEVWYHYYYSKGAGLGDQLNS